MIDFAKITVTSGNGGRGKVGWRQFKGGPDGGNGGNGGSVFLLADKDLNTLKPFQFQKVFEAESGRMGGKNRRTGESAEDLVINVPVGTVVNKKIDLTQPGQKVLVAKGGTGGRGNAAFRSPTNTTPENADPGTSGETKILELELKLLADVGLIGLPNAGKSTLLSVLTKATPKIANYPFTTLEPNLGVMDNLVIADIPGLIEGASKGKGLGIEFLRHVERCRVLVHVIDVTSETIKSDYGQVRNELAQYSKGLLDKPEIIVLNKADLLSDKQMAKAKKTLPKDAIMLSAATHKNLEELINRLKRG